MEKMVAYCGLVCTECPAYLAKRDNDNSKRVFAAKAWSTDEYIVNPEDVNCDGCHAKDGMIFMFCNDCMIRACGTDKKVENCGNCKEYECERIKFHFERIPESKELLDEINKNK